MTMNPVWGILSLSVSYIRILYPYHISVSYICILYVIDTSLVTMSLTEECTLNEFVIQAFWKWKRHYD